MTNGNEPAHGYGFTTADGSSHVEEKGLTKRELFAAMAMQALYSNPKVSINEPSNIEACVQMADALITSLNKTDDGK